MKKFISILLVLVMAASLSVAAFADEATPATGSITINGVSKGNTYAVYELLYLESYNVADGAYSYKATAKWADFFTTDQAKQYMATDKDGYVTWIAAEDDDTKATFAKGVLSYAKEKGITPDASFIYNNDVTLEDNSYKFEGLNLGYYLVDSTVGALCGLTTTNPDASVNAKNGIPTVDKQVQEDSTEQWGAHNTADIGQTVKFRVTINVHAGAENYVLHDVMSAGLTFQKIEKIEHVIPGSNTHEVQNDEYLKYTIKTANETVTDGCAFEIEFSKEFCDKLEANDKIIVYYSAMLNRNAVIANGGNENMAWLGFGEGNKSNEDAVLTYTYGVDIVKTDSSNKLIKGAKFRIYDAANGGNEIKVVKTDDGKGYRRARADETGVNIEVENGQIRVVGFDNGVYYLEEVEAPDGYNKLSARQRFIISDGNLDAVFNGDIYSTGSGVHVVNKTGSMLPETGGLGTVLFTVLGSAVVLGTGVVLVTKKRMSKIEE